MVEVYPCLSVAEVFLKDLEPRINTDVHRLMQVSGSRKKGSSQPSVLRPFVALEPVSNVEANVAGPSAIGLHAASKVLGGCSTSLDQLLHPPSYTSTTLVFSVVCFSYSTIQLALAAAFDCLFSLNP